MKQKFIWIFVICLIGIGACTKVFNTQIGADGLIPPIDGVNVKDTLIDVTAKTWGLDSAKIAIQDVNILGYRNTATFGKTTAAINIQMQPTVDSFSFPVSKDSMQLDSVVLVLGTGGVVFGDSTQNLAFKVYEIANSAQFGIEEGYPYLTSSAIPRGAELTYNNVSKIVNPLSTKDSVFTFEDTTANQLRIRLNDNFGNRLLKDYTFDKEYQTDSTFRLAFKGFQIVPEASGNALLPILLYSNNTKLAIYYKYTRRDTAATDTAVAYFRPNIRSASANQIVEDRSSAAMGTQFPLGNLDSSDNYLYVESKPGAFARVKIPALNTFPNALVYKAELVLTQDVNIADPAGKYYTEVPSLFVAAYDSSNHRRENLSKDISPSMSSNGLSYITSTSALAAFGAYPRKVADLSNPGDTVYQYRMNITRHLQSVLMDKSKNLPLDIFAPVAGDTVYDARLGGKMFIGTTSSSTGSFEGLNTTGIGQLRITGKANEAKRIKLHIIYSPITTN